MISFITEFSVLFSDIPSHTRIIEHDIDVGNATDYRLMNALTKPDSYPLPRIKDCVDQIGSANFVSKFDLLKGYWQVLLTTRAQKISSFITPFGLFSYSVMSFGLRNAPATFQRLMNKVTVGLEGCAVYLDDIVVYSDTCEQHFCCIRELFKRLSDANLTVHLAKCDFAQATVTYLGKVVGMGKVRPVYAKVIAIKISLILAKVIMKILKTFKVISAALTINAPTKS